MPGFNVGTNISGCNVKFGDNLKNVIPNTIETARTNRFELSLSIPINAVSSNKVFSQQVITLACESINRPNVQIEKETVYNGADYINVPLRAKYSPVDLVFYEILHGDQPSEFNETAEHVWLWWTKGAFNPESSRVTYPESRRTTATITMYNGMHNAVWSYELHRCWPETIIPSEVNYKDGTISKLSISLVYDKLQEVNPTYFRL